MIFIYLKFKKADSFINNKQIYYQMAIELKQQHIFLAQIAEKAQRFGDMYNAMRTAISIEPILDHDQRNLLSVAFKNHGSKLRFALRSLTSLQAQQHKQNLSKLNKINFFQAKVSEQLRKLCDEMIKILDNQLIVNGSDAQAKICYFKLKSDAYRYLSECTSGFQSESAQQNSKAAFENAQQIINILLKPTDPLRLSTALSLAVDHNQMLGDRETATKIANKAFTEGIACIDEVQNDKYKDACCILNLLKDNISIWAAQQAKEKSGSQ